MILTILTHLELGELQYLHVLPQINATCALNFHLVGHKLIASMSKFTFSVALIDRYRDRSGRSFNHFSNCFESLTVPFRGLDLHKGSMQSLVLFS